MSLRLLLLLFLITAKQAMAEPSLGAPWSRIDFGASDAQLEKSLKLPHNGSCRNGWFVSNGICWGTNDRYGFQSITLYFDTVEAARQLTASWGVATSSRGAPQADDWEEAWQLRAGTQKILARLATNGAGVAIALEPMQTLPQLVQHMRAAVGSKRATLARSLGVRIDDTCGSDDICPVELRPTEVGPSGINVELSKGVVTQVTSVVRCDKACADSATLRHFDRAFGRRTSEARERGTETWSYHTYATKPPLVVRTREALPDRLFMCFGACDE
jgi:hypothetical protein